jgi:hypothetical protein
MGGCTRSPLPSRSAAEADDLAEMSALAEQWVGELDSPLQPVHGDAWLVPLTAWTYRLAVIRREYLDLARTRLAWALDGLRSPPWG